MKMVLEPSFYQKIEKNLKTVKNGTGAKFYIENFKNHDTDFFLYNIENFMLVGNSIFLDRSKN